MLPSLNQCLCKYQKKHGLNVHTKSDMLGCEKGDVGVKQRWKHEVGHKIQTTSLMHISSTAELHVAEVSILWPT